MAGQLAYSVACEVATENLRAEATGTRLVQLELTLSDTAEHRRWVEDRRGCAGPSWEQVVDLEYDPWVETTDGRRLLVDHRDTAEAWAASLM